MPVAVRRIEGHYEMQEVPFGKVYRWCPEHAAAEYDERANPTASSTHRRCNVDRETETGTGLVTPERSDDETLHPWRYAGNSEDDGLPC